MDVHQAIGSELQAGAMQALALARQGPEYKNAAKRPGANEGGREEEERPGIAAEPGRLRRLRNNETVFCQRYR
jgi:hypothetical protein